MYMHSYFPFTPDAGLLILQLFVSEITIIFDEPNRAASVMQKMHRSCPDKSHQFKATMKCKSIVDDPDFSDPDNEVFVLTRVTLQHLRMIAYEWRCDVLPLFVIMVYMRLGTSRLALSILLRPWISPSRQGATLRDCSTKHYNTAQLKIATYHKIGFFGKTPSGQLSRGLLTASQSTAAEPATFTMESTQTSMSAFRY